MRRAVAIFALGLAAVALAVVAWPNGDDDAGPPRYEVELSNAFGLADGSDVKIAGVRAGRVTGMRVDWPTRHAMIGIQIDREGFGDLRADARCDARPQSLIGEYFLDCDPGRSAKLLDRGGTIPISRTTSTVAPDLIYAIQQRPVRERLRIVLDELGVGLASRGGALNEAIRRASPALRETDKVLAVLAARRERLASLTRDADTLLKAISDRRSDVGRFVREAAGASTTVASRREALRNQIRRLPGFLDQLQPAMRSLGIVADRQTPALRDLSATAPELLRFLRISRSVSRTSRPATAALGEAAVTGREAIRAATPAVDELRRSSQHVGEVAKDARFVAEDVDSRDRVVEPDERSPGGKGFTGLESLARLPYLASLGANFYDRYSYLSRGTTFVDPVCGRYVNAETARKDEATLKRCRSWLGPRQPAITAPDPSDRTSAAANPATLNSRQRARAARDYRAATRPAAVSRRAGPLLDYLLGP